MRDYEELKMLLCEELEKIAKKGELTAGSLDTIDKLTHSIKSLLTIMAMEEGGESYARYGGSYARGRSREGGSYRDGRSREGGSYESYARGQRRDSMGRYSRRGYSREDDIAERLMDIMEDIDDPKVKQTLHKAIEKMEE